MSGTPKNSAEYQKVIILSDLAILFCNIDLDRAKKCLEQAIQGLEFIEPEENSGTRKRIISAIVRLNEICPDDELINRSLEVASKITDPVEYIDSLTAIFTMVRSDQDRRSGILAYMTEAAERIHSPYEKASLFLTSSPFPCKTPATRHR